METIFRGAIRHIIFILLAFVVLYIIAVSFGAPLNYFSWSEAPTFLFGAVVNISAVGMHIYMHEEG